MTFPARRAQLGNSLKRLVRARLLPHSNTLILAYHRIANPIIDPQLLSVSPQHFGEHLEVMRRFHEPTRLDQVGSLLAAGNTRARGLVITFDDGYRDNLAQAVPLMETFDVPAAVFVVTGPVGGDRFFYWDVLAYIFLVKPNLPDHLTLSVSGQNHIWQVEPELDGELLVPAVWNVLSASDPLRRCTAYREITNLLRQQTPRVRAELLNYLIEWANMSPAEMHPQFDTLSESDLGRLAQHALMEIGAHTISHPRMSHLSAEEQQQEIVGSKRALQEMISRPVLSFSYPYGSRSDFNTTTVDLVRQAGFERACANFEARLGRETDPYGLPRFLVRNWDGDEFQRRLAEWFERY